MLWIGNGLYLRIGDVMLIVILIKKNFYGFLVFLF